MASTGYEFLGHTFLVIFLSILIKSVCCSKFDYDFVTCGSALKILNVANNVRLHSHDVKYGSGSGQQSVTGVDSSDDHNSYWQVRAKTGTSCIRGNPIKCGQTVRLTHVATKRNLHSHHFQSPLSRNLEVSAFGDNGEGDEGDNWVIVCSDKYWSRNDRFRIKHVTTEHFLHVTGDTYGRPIHGQREISAFPEANDLNYWQAAEGIYIKPTEVKSRQSQDDEEEEEEPEEDEDPLEHGSGLFFPHQFLMLDPEVENTELEHAQNVQVIPTGYLIRYPGVYHLYMQAVPDASLHDLCNELTDTPWQISIVLIRPKEPLMSGTLLTTDHSSCGSYVMKGTNDFIKDVLSVLVSDSRLVQLGTNASFFGLMQL